MAALSPFNNYLMRNFNTATRNLPFCLLMQRRFRYKKKWAVNLASKSPCELALEHFDAFYKPLYGSRWPSIRVSLLSPKKYAAIINNASDSEIWSQNLAELGARDLIMGAAKRINKTVLQEEASKETTLYAEESDNSINSRVEPSLESDRVNRQKNEAEMFSERKEEIGLSPRDTEHTCLDQEVVSKNFSVDEKDQNTVQNNSVAFSKESLHTDDNNLTPDTLYNSTDLEHFMPTEQVFSEREILRKEEFSQSMYQERPIAVTVLPGHQPLLPLSLRVMAFPKGDVSDFPMPKTDAANLLNYYLLDGASILPVLALDLRPHDNVLDLCAAPGGKTLAMLQVIISQGGHLSSNDVSETRLRRLKTVLKSYFSKDLLSEFVTVLQRQGLSFRNPDYNKVLVDVPCNSDRHVLLSEDNNLFKPGRLNERLQMTSLQKDLLLAGLRACKPGGSVVYSTCTLAAVQNDGVVQAALEQLWETTSMDVVVEDLSPLRNAFSSIFSFHSGARLGQLVLPSLTRNFGPMYICKLRRLQ